MKKSVPADPMFGKLIDIDNEGKTLMNKNKYLNNQESHWRDVPGTLYQIQKAYDSSNDAEKIIYLF